MKIKEVMAMPLGKVTTITPAGTDPTKAIVSIKTADGKDIQTTQGALVPGPNNTFQIKPDAAMQSGTELKPGATVTQSPDQSSGSASASSLSTDALSTSEELDDGLVGGDDTDDFINDVEDKEFGKLEISKIKKLAGV